MPACERRDGLHGVLCLYFQQLPTDAFKWRREPRLLRDDLRASRPGDAIFRCASRDRRRSLQPSPEFEQREKLGGNRVVESIVYGVSSFGGRPACTGCFQQVMVARRRPRPLSFMGRVVLPELAGWEMRSFVVRVALEDAPPNRSLNSNRVMRSVITGWWRLSFTRRVVLAYVPHALSFFQQLLVYRRGPRPPSLIG